MKKRKRQIFGTKERSRLSVFRSNRHIYAQIIDDQKGETLCACNDLELKLSKKKPTEVALEVGKALAKKAQKKKIKKVVFDRGRYKFHGQVKALAEGAREKGLEF